MGKVFNKVILVTVAAAYLLFLLFLMYAKWNHIPIAATVLSIGIYVKIVFYVYLLLYVAYYLFKMSKSRNK